MRKGDVKIFADRQKLFQMVNLRRIGWAETSLGMLFGCDRSSIKEQCQKYKINPLRNIYTIERIASKAMPFERNKTDWRMIGGEKICLGRSYSDYLH